ncbi:MAG: WYL domain-containing protein [Ruminococcus sp.]|nr:WYL domain-containing protein [Ruminococcus sp.]
MTVFSEIYGAYFRIAARVLERNITDEREIKSIISREGFRDSILFLPQKLIPQADFSDWRLLMRTEDGKLKRVTKNPPVRILTLLQKSWLRAKLSDPRIRLFLGDDEISRLNERLSGVMPLYVRENFRFTDMYGDGDDFGSESYRENFGKILSAVKNHEILNICFKSRKGSEITGGFLPLKIEYSRKNNKFRVYCFAVRDGGISHSGTINIGRIEDIKNTGIIYDGKTDMKKYFMSRRCSEPVTVRVTPQRNGVARFLTEFSSYEKHTAPDPETGGCIVRIHYDRYDETELLIQLLGFGSVVEIISPPRFRQLAAERVKKQYDLIFGNS